MEDIILVIMEDSKLVIMEDIILKDIIKEDIINQADSTMVVILKMDNTMVNLTYATVEYHNPMAIPLDMVAIVEGSTVVPIFTMEDNKVIKDIIVKEGSMVTMVIKHDEQLQSSQR